MRGTSQRPPSGLEWRMPVGGYLAGPWAHGKGAGTTEPAPLGPAGDAGPIKPGGTKTLIRPSNQPPPVKLQRASAGLRSFWGEGT